MEETNTRTRMKLSETAKGLIQWECTAEYDTPEQSAEQLAKAIQLIKKTIADAGLIEVGVEK